MVKEQCFALLEDPGHDSLIISKRGRLVARLLPLARGAMARTGSSDRDPAQPH